MREQTHSTMRLTDPRFEQVVLLNERNMTPAVIDCVCSHILCWAKPTHIVPSIKKLYLFGSSISSAMDVLDYITKLEKFGKECLCHDSSYLRDLKSVFLDWCLGVISKLQSAYTLDDDHPLIMAFKNCQVKFAKSISEFVEKLRSLVEELKNPTTKYGKHSLVYLIPAHNHSSLCDVMNASAKQLRATSKLSDLCFSLAWRFVYFGDTSIFQPGKTFLDSNRIVAGSMQNALSGSREIPTAEMTNFFREMLYSFSFSDDDDQTFLTDIQSAFITTFYGIYDNFMRVRHDLAVNVLTICQTVLGPLSADAWSYIKIHDQASGEMFQPHSADELAQYILTYGQARAERSCLAPILSVLTPKNVFSFTLDTILAKVMAKVGFAVQKQKVKKFTGKVKRRADACLVEEEQIFPVHCRQTVPNSPSIAILPVQSAYVLRSLSSAQVSQLFASIAWRLIYFGDVHALDYFNTYVGMQGVIVGGMQQAMSLSNDETPDSLLTTLRNMLKSYRSQMDQEQRRYYPEFLNYLVDHLCHVLEMNTANLELLEMYILNACKAVLANVSPELWSGVVFPHPAGSTSGNICFHSAEQLADVLLNYMRANSVMFRGLLETLTVQALTFPEQRSWVLGLDIFAQHRDTILKIHGDDPEAVRAIDALPNVIEVTSRNRRPLGTVFVNPDVDRWRKPKALPARAATKRQRQASARSDLVTSTVVQGSVSGVPARSMRC